MYITSKVQLQEYIFRKLGSEAHRVEISDTNFNDIYNESLNYLNEYSDDAVIRKTIILNVGNQYDLTLNDNVGAINWIYTGNDYFNTSAFYPGISPVYDFLRSSSTDTSSFILFNVNMQDIRKTFRTKVNFDYNPETKSLHIGEQIDQCVIDYFEVEDEALLYESRLFLMLLERDCWKQWKVNVQGKYIGSTIGNGVSINGDFMDSQFDKLDEKIKESVESEEFDFLAPRPIQ